MPIVVSLFDDSGIWPAFAGADWEKIAVSLRPSLAAVARQNNVQSVKVDVREFELPARVDVLLCSPPCQALSRQRHLAGRQQGRTGPCAPSMTTEEGLALVRFCVDLADALRPLVFCLENPAASLAWTVLPRKQTVLLGWWGFPAKKATSFGGNFIPVPLPDPLPAIDPTAGGRRPSGALKRRGGVQAMPSYLRSITPEGFARDWWAAQRAGGLLP